MILVFVLLVVILVEIALLNDRLGQRAGLDSWDRVRFDFRNYPRLRSQGLSHGQATDELDLMWKRR